MSRSIPIERRDRPWMSTRTVYMAGPLPVPPIDVVRSRLRTYARLNPTSRLTWTVSEDGRHWELHDVLPDSAVVEREWPVGTSIEQVLDRLYSDESLASPVAVVCLPEHIALVSRHGLWDGRNATTISEAVVRAAVCAEYHMWPAHASSRAPLLKAAIKTFARHPGKLRDAIADRPVEQTDSSSGTEIAWKPSMQAIVSTIPNEMIDEAIERAAAGGIKVSRFSLLSVLLLRTFDELGFEVESNVNVMADLRNYLGEGWIDGNFVATVPLRLDENSTPGELSAVLKRTLKSGRPLASSILSSMHTGGKRYVPNPLPSTIDAGRKTQLTITDLGVLPRKPLPFTGKGPAIWAQTAPPAGPSAVTVGFTRTPDVTVVCASGYDTAIDADLLRKSIDALASDPAGVLADSGGHA